MGNRLIAARKRNLPSQIKHLDVMDLSLLHMKVLLEFLGVSLAMQGGGREGRAAKIREIIASEPAKAQFAYETIVLNKLPQADQKVIEDASAMKAHFHNVMGQLMEGEKSEMLRASIEQHVVAMGAKLRDELVRAGREALAKAAENYRPIVIKEGNTRRVVKGVLPKEFERIVQLCGTRIPTMLVGPAGCGKTYLASKVAESLGLDFSAQSCSQGISESTFTGWLLPVGKSGQFEYVESPFVHAYENGGVFLLDEMDNADPNLLVFFNMALANDQFFLPQRYKKPLVKRHKNFVVIAAANTFGHGANAQYVGRNALDAATLDRFRAGMMHMDYSDEVENALVDPAVLEWGRKVRACINKERLRRIMSTRVMLDLTKMKESSGWGVDEWERSFFADWSKEEVAKWRAVS